MGGHFDGDRGGVDQIGGPADRFLRCVHQSCLRLRLSNLKNELYPGKPGNISNKQDKEKYYEQDDEEILGGNP